MRVPFRQGLVRVGPSNFVEVIFPYVRLNVGNQPFVATIASGAKDYLWIENQTVNNAWGPLTQGQTVWLYIDVDARTGARTFGLTTLLPITSSITPSSPVSNQHWYDAGTEQMKVWSGVVWQAKIRVFVAKLNNGSVVESVSALAPDFTGTQVGDNSEVFSGQLLYDAENLPIKHQNGKFVTTEDHLRTRVQSTADVKFGSIQNEAEAGENLAKYTIVRYTDFGIIEHANTFSPSQMGQFGIIEQDVLTGGLVTVVTSGVVTNLDWDWSTAGINAPLYCDAAGALSTTQQLPLQQPVAIIVDQHSIQIASPMVTINKYEFQLASLETHGIARLNIEPAAFDDPVAVGANDPRMTDARVPLAHVHEIEEITNLPDQLDALLLKNGGTMTGEIVLSSSTPSTTLVAASRGYVEAQDAFRVAKAGDTMTGLLTLSGDPTADLHAATKQYVVAKAGSTMTGLLTLSGAPSSDLHAATKKYVDDTVLGFVSLTGGTMTGILILSADPTSGMHAATKQYVDNVADNSLPLAGGTMTGDIVLSGDPTDNLHAATKQFVVAKAGDTMTGLLTLSGDPTDNLHAATKQFVVAKAGDTMTGALTLSGAPSSDLHAATKLYVDGKVSKSGDTMTGALTLPSNPTSPLHAATKQYVDASAAFIYQLSCSDLVSTITVGTNKAYFRIPVATALSTFKFSLLTASTSGNVTVSVSRNGVALAASPYTITALSKTATINMLPHAITFAVDDEITVGVTAAGTGAKGLIMGIVGSA